MIFGVFAMMLLAVDKDRQGEMCLLIAAVECFIELCIVGKLAGV